MYSIHFIFILSSSSFKSIHIYFFYLQRILGSWALVWTASESASPNCHPHPSLLLPSPHPSLLLPVTTFSLSQLSTCIINSDKTTFSNFHLFLFPLFSIQTFENRKWSKDNMIFFKNKIEKKIYFLQGFKYHYRSRPWLLQGML